MKRETGLTLAEVLVALAVLGIVIAVLTTAIDLLRKSRQSEFKVVQPSDQPGT